MRALLDSVFAEVLKDLFCAMAVGRMVGNIIKEQRQRGTIEGSRMDQPTFAKPISRPLLDSRRLNGATKVRDALSWEI